MGEQMFYEYLVLKVYIARMNFTGSFAELMNLNDVHKKAVLLHNHMHKN